MKTSVIRYRVADFLREHPPFDVLSLEDLLAFSGNGRVIFHEDDIYLFRKGDPLESVFWVIQQGKIEMLDQLSTGDQLRDVLGPGDVLGLRRHEADLVYQRTARTATEVILYAFDLRAFEALVGMYPEAMRYLTAHNTAAVQGTKALQAPVNRERLLTEREKSVWLNAKGPMEEWLERRLVTGEARLPLREAANRMARAGREVLAVVNAEGHPLGLLTTQDLRDHLATGAALADVPIAALMNRRLLTAPPGMRTADYLLEMMSGRSQWLALTDDGSPASPLRGIVADSDLEIAGGRNPIPLLRELSGAETVADLAYLWHRVEALLAESLVGPTVIEWLSTMMSEFQGGLIERLIRFGEAELARAGRFKPAAAHCWLLFGAAGRRELLASTLPEIGVVYLDSPPDQEADTAKYFSMLAQKVAAKLESCGWRSERVGGEAGTRRRARSLSEWKEYYRALIDHPIGNGVHAEREILDFHALSGELSIAAELHRFIAAAVAGSETFIPVLANNTIASLPPLTFYQGNVLEPDGRLRSTLDVGKTALTPITDAARVMSMAEREVFPANTLQRLRQLASRLPRYSSILTDAAEAWRIVCYHHTLAGLSTGGDSSLINPANLSRFEQRMLKSAFDSTRRLVELASSIHEVEALS